MSDMIKSVAFALGMCIVCGLLLTVAATALQERQELNRRIDRDKNILYTVDLISREKTYTPQEIDQIYKNNIEKVQVGPDGRIAGTDRGSEDEVSLLSIYLYMEDDKIQAYIIPIESQGLWGKIHGYMALENDGSTVKGFTVYQHSETPGLGGEIEKKWFQQNFEGKKIVDQGGNFVAVQIAKGNVEKQIPDEKQPHYVDGISGATLTGKYLSKGLEKTLSRYEPVSLCFRKNRLHCRLQEENSQGEQ
jgi:Na+-transporting NADH:ubiquinone oxidoreductase subunit C